MKRIRVTVIDEYLVPDDWMILTHLEDENFCLHGDLEYFIPYIQWAQRGPLPKSGKSRSPVYATWSTVGDGRDNWFLGRLEQQDCVIEEIK